MAPERETKPYLEAWVKRMRRELSVSGRLSELAFIMSQEGCMDQHGWRLKIQRILDREEDPGFDLLTRIDSVLASPMENALETAPEPGLFMMLGNDPL